MPTFDQIRKLYPERAQDSDEAILKWVADTTKLPITQLADRFGYETGGGKNSNRMSASVDSYQSNLYGLGEAATERVAPGVSRFMQRGRERNEISADVASARAREAGAVDRWADVHSPSDFGDYAVGLGVQALPYVAESAGGGLGVGLLARGLATGARALARTVGGVAASYPSSVGDILSSQRDQAGGRTDLGAAAALGIPYAAANAVGVEGAAARAELFRSGLRRLDDIRGVRGGLTRAGASGLRTGATESVSETFQEGMNQRGRMAVDPNEEFMSPEARERFAESAIGGGVLGGILGGGAGGWRRTKTVDDGPTDLKQDFPRLGYTPPQPPSGPVYPVFPDGTVARDEREELDARYPNNPSARVVPFNPPPNGAVEFDESAAHDLIERNRRTLRNQYQLPHGGTLHFDLNGPMAHNGEFGPNLPDDTFRPGERIPIRPFYLTPTKRPHSAIDIEMQQDVEPLPRRGLALPGEGFAQRAQPLALTPEQEARVWQIAADKADRGEPLTTTEAAVLRNRNTPQVVVPQTVQTAGPRDAARQQALALESPTAQQMTGQQQQQPQPEAHPLVQSQQGQLFLTRAQNLFQGGFLDEQQAGAMLELVRFGRFGEAKKIMDEAQSNKDALDKTAEQANKEQEKLLTLQRQQQQKAQAQQAQEIEDAVNNDYAIRAEKNQLHAQIMELAEERAKTLSKDGKRAKIGSEKRKKWDALTKQIKDKEAQYKALDAETKESKNAGAAGTDAARAADSAGSQRVQPAGSAGNVGEQPAQQPDSRAPAVGGAQAPAAVQPDPVDADALKPPAEPQTDTVSERDEDVEFDDPESQDTLDLIERAETAKTDEEYESILDTLYLRWRDDGDRAAMRWFEDNLRVVDGKPKNAAFAKDVREARLRAGEEVDAAGVTKLGHKVRERLQDQDVARLEAHYGRQVSDARFWWRLRDDVADYVTRGKEAVAEAIRDIIKTLAAAVLAVGIVFNPQGVRNSYAFNLPQTVKSVHSVTTTRTETVLKPVRAEVPAAAAPGMSPLARRVYENMAPVAQQSGKGFMIADKPAGTIHVFGADGALLSQGPALYGKSKGDVLTPEMAAKQLNQLTDADRVTPAGQFTLEVSNDPEYTGGKTFVLKETQMGGAVVAVHSVYLGNPQEKREMRLASPTAADNRISSGCINTTQKAFLDEILPHADQLEGGAIFVLPDEVQATDAYFPQSSHPETVETTTVEAQPTERTDPGANVGDPMGGALGDNRRAQPQARNAAGLRRRRNTPGKGAEAQKPEQASEEMPPPQPGSSDNPESLARKRLAVLKQLRKCVGG